MGFTSNPEIKNRIKANNLSTLNISETGGSKFKIVDTTDHYNMS